MDYNNFITTLKIGYYLRTFYAIVLFTLLLFNARAQQHNVLENVSGYPATSVFDMLLDARGFLWIASDVGIAKYDGVSFTKYSSPLQSSVSVIFLAADKYGRIWFSTLNGQIFYILNDRVQLLTAYKNTDEPNFPRFGIFKNQLLATTHKGLFVCDLNTLRCHYETCKNMPGAGTLSLSILSNKVLAAGAKGFFVYRPQTGLSLVNLTGADGRMIIDNSGTFSIKGYGDTAFLYCNPKKLVYKMVSTVDGIRAVGQVKVSNYVNNIQLAKKGYWINTTTCSIKKPETDSIKGYGLNCILEDKHGTQWYGSLQKGLIRDFESEDLFRFCYDIKLLKGDIIQSLMRCGNKLLIGTQGGKLLLYDPYTKAETLLAQIPKEDSGIAFMKLLDKDQVLFSSSFHTFIYDQQLKKITQSYPAKALKQADTIGNAFILATSAGVFVQHKPGDTAGYRHWKAQFFNHFKGLSELDATTGLTWLGEHRTRAVCCIQSTKTIWTAFTNGLFKIDSSGVKEFLFKNAPVYASSLISYKDKVIVGTFNRGMLIINGDKVTCLTTRDGLLSNIILKLKKTDCDLWLYNNDDILQCVDLNTFKIVNRYALPGIDDPAVISVAEIDQKPFLATVNGLYRLSKRVNTSNMPVYLNSLTLNGTDTDAINHMVLKSYQNDVQFNLGIPALLNGKDISIKYRLLTGNTTSWTTSEPGERNFRFSSLSPGKYQFDALAFMPQLNIESQRVHFQFTISSPWWKRWWAISCMVLFGGLTIFTILRLYYLNRLSTEKTEYEKQLAVEKERQRISDDMHDDISASLSAIKLFTGSIKNSPDLAGDVNSIHKMVADLSDKTREVIWTLNKDNDTVESLIYFIEAMGVKLFAHTDIQLIIHLPEVIPGVTISNEKRRDVFLMVKEVMHNIIKHAKGTKAWLDVRLSDDKYLEIDVRDNGVGIPVNQKTKVGGQGLSTIRKRIHNLGGEVNIKTDYGTIISFKIPV